MVNPLGYVERNKILFNTFVFQAQKKLRIKSKLDLRSIYVERTGINKSTFDNSFYNSRCDDGAINYHRAHFSQYFHYINRDFPLKNIPELGDVVGQNMTVTEYKQYKAHYTKNKKLIDTYVNSTDCPCKTVIPDSAGSGMLLINPKSTPDNLKKEHVGVIGRIGFTYGKFTAKIKFTPLLSKSNVWNGITAAFWLLAQETDQVWNTLTPADVTLGYIPKGAPDNDASLGLRKSQETYSEIDFEILKESQYWPITSYTNKKKFKYEYPEKNNDIVVTCTNWDLACREPKLFNIGAVEHEIENVSYVHHRWDNFYKALTTKISVDHSELFLAPYYYFEIDWQPEKITWRIGPEKDKMRTICVMDKTVTAVPSNQMSVVVTQEWHNQEWWPTAPFKQNYIPFPKKDLVGKILEIEVE